MIYPLITIIMKIFVDLFYISILSLIRTKRDQSGQLCQTCTDTDSNIQYPIMHYFGIPRITQSIEAL